MILEKIRERLQKANQGVCHLCGCDLYSEDVIGIINQVESEYNNGWIPCSERLPKYDEYVLCQGKNSQFIACIDSLDNKWKDGHFYVRTNITHWQPLPQPPKGE